MRPLLALVLASCAHDAPAEVPRSSAPPGFWEAWGDGQAEVAGYRLAQPRYGELRHGEAVVVVVTEDMTRATRVKSDGGHDDAFPVLKLNEIRDYQTGIYDYNVLTSAWLPLDGSLPLGQPTKVSLSVQEWCGHVYEQLVVDPGRAARALHSYFDGEADRDERLEVPAGAVFADTLPLIVRGLGGELLAPGEEVRVPLLPRRTDDRYAHTEPAFAPATLRRVAGQETVTVPAGTYAVERWEAETASGRFAWWVELAPPRHLVAWSGPDGERGELAGVTRIKYWQTHDEGDEALRAKLGLSTGGRGGG